MTARIALILRKRSVIEGVNSLESDTFPSLHHRKEGRTASSRKMPRSHRSRRSRGGFPFVPNRKTTPASRQRRLRDILLIARPPLLAVVLGGEFCLIQFVHTSLDRAHS